MVSNGAGRTNLPRKSLLAGALAVVLLVGIGLAVGVGNLLALVADTDPTMFVVGLVGIVVAVACWGEAQRRLLVAAGATLSTRQGFLGYGAGMFAKQILPAGHALGPGLVAYSFRSVTRRSYSETFAAVTLAELLNFVASGLLVAAGLVLLLRAESSPTVSTARTALLVVGLLLGVVVTLAWYRRADITAGVHGVAWLVRGSIGRVSRRVRDVVSPPAISGAIERFYATFDVIAGQRRQLAIAFAFTVTGWGAFVAPLYTSFRALGVTLPLGVVLVVVPAAGLANAVPLPGGLGGAELAVGGAVVVLVGLDVTTAAAGVLLYRLCAFWFMTALGGMCATVLRVGVTDLIANVSDTAGTTR